mmetsp:Transcript_22077/g.50550  ORF Transcript_22077/g.50550 Transcript_22077/m.50550 type:complete len:512 (+) Transcript_22077:54-1589(+)
MLLDRSASPTGARVAAALFSAVFCSTLWWHSPFQILPDDSAFTPALLTEVTQFVRELNESEHLGNCIDSPHLPSCMVRNDGGLDHASYDAAIASCVWKPYHIEQLRAQVQPPSGNSSIDVMVNSTDICHSGGWIALRVGPFDTTGGSDWNNVDGFLPKDMLPFWRGDFLAFTDIAIGNVDENDKFIGYPPIMQHHFHVCPSGNLLWDDANNHDDSQCHADDGGTNCLIHRAPPGHAFFYRQPMDFFSTFIDVRAKGTPLMRSWAFLAFKPAPSHIPHVQYLYEAHAGHGWNKWSGMHGYYARSGAMSVGSVYWLADLREPSYIWQTGIMEWTNTTKVYETLGHVHWNAIADVLLFQGEASAVFDNVTAAGPIQNQIMGYDAALALMENIKTRRKRPGYAKLICSLRSAGKPEQAYVSGRLTTINRKPLCHIDPSVSFSFTSIGFIGKQNPYLSDEDYLHAMIRSYTNFNEGKIRLPIPGKPKPNEFPGSDKYFMDQHTVDYDMPGYKPGDT